MSTCSMLVNMRTGQRDQRFVLLRFGSAFTCRRGVVGVPGGLFGSLGSLPPNVNVAGGELTCPWVGDKVGLAVGVAWNVNPKVGCCVCCWGTLNPALFPAPAPNAKAVGVVEVDVPNAEGKT